MVDHEQHQKAIGQRGLNLTPLYRVSPVTFNFGNNSDERVRRLMNFTKNRLLGADTTPYLAPWSGKVTCFMDAVDSQSRALIAQLMGDIITVDSTVTEEYQADYEILTANYTIPAHDGSESQTGDAQSDAPTIDLTLRQYLPGSFQLLEPPRQKTAIPFLLRQGECFLIRSTGLRNPP